MAAGAITEGGALTAIGTGAAFTAMGAGALGASLVWLTRGAHNDQKACVAGVVDTPSLGFGGIGMGIEKLGSNAFKASVPGYDLGSGLFGAGGLAIGTFGSES